MPTKWGQASGRWNVMNSVLSGLTFSPLRRSQSVTVKKPSAHFCQINW